jgi:hypothetical protein
MRAFSQQTNTPSPLSSLSTNVSNTIVDILNPKDSFVQNKKNDDLLPSIYDQYNDNTSFFQPKSNDIMNTVTDILLKINALLQSPELRGKISETLGESIYGINIIVDDIEPIIIQFVDKAGNISKKLAPKIIDDFVQILFNVAEEFPIAGVIIMLIRNIDKSLKIMLRGMIMAQEIIGAYDELYTENKDRINKLLNHDEIIPSINPMFNNPNNSITNKILLSQKNNTPGKSYVNPKEPSEEKTLVESFKKEPVKPSEEPEKTYVRPSEEPVEPSQEKTEEISQEKPEEMFQEEPEEMFQEEPEEMFQEEPVKPFEEKTLVEPSREEPVETSQEEPEEPSQEEPEETPNEKTVEPYSKEPVVQSEEKITGGSYHSNIIFSQKLRNIIKSL